MDIRELEKDEIWVCSRFGPDFHSEKHLSDDFEFDVFHDNWVHFYNTDIGRIFALYNDADEIIGGIGGIVAKDLTSGKLKVNELFWYIEKDQRHSSGRWPLRLVQRLREWGKSKGATRFQMVHLLEPGEEPSTVSLASLYTKVLKLRPFEVAYEGEI